MLIGITSANYQLTGLTNKHDQAPILSIEKNNIYYSVYLFKEGGDIRYSYNLGKFKKDADDLVFQNGYYKVNIPTVLNFQVDVLEINDLCRSAVESVKSNIFYVKDYLLENIVLKTMLVLRL
ncbi:hypothetical protein LJC10_02375 [Selenomonadales bacterium OttesenSCG-928-I06]|nr:hypothetical protein [Selenomonadales bacterium OttesenSCG-928-I06]